MIKTRNNSTIGNVLTSQKNEHDSGLQYSKNNTHYYKSENAQAMLFKYTLIRKT